MLNKKFFIYIIMIIALLFLNINCYAKKGDIILNTPLTDDVNHTFMYPNIEINNNVNPYSITLAIENGYFNTNNETLNNDVSLYFDFVGGTNTNNLYIDNLNITEDYKLISFNIKNTVDLSNKNTKNKVINSIRNFISNILFKNELNKDAKFSLTFSELELSLSDNESNLDGIKLIAFKDPTKNKEHYYARIDDPGIDWRDAYKTAASLKWNGLQGYLVTITSEEEHNFIYQSLESIEGWMGAAAITNYEDINYNTNETITWTPAINDLIRSKSYESSDSQNDKDIRKYWRWVSGPEAGQKIFEDGAYTNFNSGEPNNYVNGEWCGEYGFGVGGTWNDYPADAESIEGYYIEFGGFDDEQEIIEPVSLVNTFKWNDYDFRNINENIQEEIIKITIPKDINESDIEDIINETIANAIIESGVENVTYTIINQSINKGILNVDIEVTIGEINPKTYTIHINKKIKDYIEEVNETNVTSDPAIETPKTGDNIIIYTSMFMLSLILLVVVLKKLNRS